MKRIGNSKEPTIQLMLNITSNLRDKFHKFSSVQTWVRHYTHISKPGMSYDIYIEDTFYKSLETWPELLIEYRRLMNE